MPVLNKMKKYKTNYIPIKPVMKDESTTSNNIQILEDIFVRQFKFKEDDSTFASVIRLIYGDLKTWSRMQSVKELRRGISEQSFDRFDWILPGLGLWHLRFNMLQLIHKIHWGEAQPVDPSTLQYAADRWGRARVVQPNDFQALEDLIIQSYQARIVGTWIRFLRKDGYAPQRIEATISWLTAQTCGQDGTWMNMLGRISRKLHAELPSTSIDMLPPTLDQQFQNHQNFCDHVESYLTLRYAIKYADIGLLRHALRHATVIFQASVAGTPKYAQALLYTLHAIDSSAATIRLQESILMNSLVNLRGDEESSFETARLLEILNNNLKMFQHERSYFSKYSDTLLENWALNGPYLMKLKEIVEFYFGRVNSSRHPAKSAAEDVWGMATALAHKSLCKRSYDRFSTNPTANLYVEGLKKLGENVLKYNQQYLSEEISKEISTDDLEGKYEAEPDFVNETKQVPDSPIISMARLEISGGMFFD